MNRRRKSVRMMIALTLIIGTGMINSHFCYAETYHIPSDGDKATEKNCNELLKDYQNNSSDMKQIESKYSIKQKESGLDKEKRDENEGNASSINCTLETYRSLKSNLESSLKILKDEYVYFTNNYQLNVEDDVEDIDQGKEGNNSKEKETETKEEIDNHEKEQKKEERQKERIKVYEATVKQYEDTIAQYEEQLDTLNKQIETLSTSYTSARKVFLDSELQANLNKFYITNGEKCIKEEQNKLLYQFYEKLISLIGLNEQKLYYEQYDSSLNNLLKVEDIRDKYGISLKNTRLDLNVKKGKNELNLSQLKHTKDSIMNEVKEVTLDNEVRISIGYDTAKKSYSKDNLYHRLLENNISYLKMTDEIDVYYQYNSLNPYITLLERERMEEVIKSLEFQKKMMETSLEQYVKTMLDSYDLILLEIDSVKAEREYLKQQYNTTKAAYRHGKATQIDIDSIIVKQKEEDISYFKLIEKKLLLEFVLEHDMYGVTLE